MAFIKSTANPKISTGLVLMSRGPMVNPDARSTVFHRGTLPL